MADSDRIVEIIIETNDKTGGALGAVQSKLLAFDKAVLRTQERLKRMTKDTYQASISLIDKVTPQGSKINSLLKGFAGKAYQASIGLIDRTTGGIRSLEAKLMQLTGKAYNVTVGLKDQASKGIKNIADGALMGMGGMGLSMLGGAGIGLGAVNAINVYKDYEQQMANVKALIATGDKAIDTKNMDTLIAKSKELGATTKFKASEVGKAFEYMGLAGWKTEQMLSGVPALLNLAAASGEELASVSDILTDSMTGFGLEAGKSVKNAKGVMVDSSTHFADVLAAMATNSNTTVGMAGEASKYASGVIGALYKSQSQDDKMRAMEDWAMFTGLMANSGIKGSMAGTATRSMFTRLASMQQNAAAATSALGVDFAYQESGYDDFGNYHEKGQTRRARDIIGDIRQKFIANSKINNSVRAMIKPTFNI